MFIVKLRFTSIVWTSGNEEGQVLISEIIGMATEYLSL